MESKLYKVYSHTSFNKFGFRPLHKIHFDEFTIIKETAKGYWVQQNSFDNKRFVLKEGRALFARTTKERALVDFICRKKKQIKSLKNYLENVESYLYEAEKKMEMFLLHKDISFAGVNAAEAAKDLRKALLKFKKINHGKD